MTNSAQRKSWILNLSLRPATAALLMTILFALTAVATQAAHAQTFQVIHAFDISDGWYPDAGLTIDHAGNLYGTTDYGGNDSGNCHPMGYCGTVFKLNHHGSGWVLSELYKFDGGDDGYNPEARVVFGPDGKLYGSAVSGGSGGAGVVFSLQPPASACKSASCPWTETVLFPFRAYGALDLTGDLSFDAAGNIYGATFYGGNYEYCQEEGCGTIYELTQSGGIWTENILYIFTGGADGEYPTSVLYGHDGNLYGTAQGDPNNQSKPGLVFQFVPSDGSWTENVLHQFQITDGEFPVGGLIFDSAGNLYGSTVAGGYYGDGTVYELSPSGNYWYFSSLYSFSRSLPLIPTAPSAHSSWTVPETCTEPPGLTALTDMARFSS